MKKLLVVLPLTLLMLSLTMTIASAGVDWEDPALCVNGQWLLVDAASPAAITVSLPEGARYGDQTAGGCKTPAPTAQLIKNVKARGDGNALHVQVDGKFASTPMVKATFGKAAEIKKNNGHENISFRFDLPRRND